jgi:hypothetical protein
MSRPSWARMLGTCEGRCRTPGGARSWSACSPERWLALWRRSPMGSGATTRSRTAWRFSSRRRSAGSSCSACSCTRRTCAATGDTHNAWRSPAPPGTRSQARPGTRTSTDTSTGGCSSMPSVKLGIMNETLGSRPRCVGQDRRAVGRVARVLRRMRRATVEMTTKTSPFHTPETSENAAITPDDVVPSESAGRLADHTQTIAVVPEAMTRLAASTKRRLRCGGSVVPVAAPAAAPSPPNRMTSSSRCGVVVTTHPEPTSSVSVRGVIAHRLPLFCAWDWIGKLRHVSVRSDGTASILRRSELISGSIGSCRRSRGRRHAVVRVGRGRLLRRRRCWVRRAFACRICG